MSFALLDSFLALTFFLPLPCLLTLNRTLEGVGNWKLRGSLDGVNDGVFAAILNCLRVGTLEESDTLEILFFEVKYDGLEVGARVRILDGVVDDSLVGSLGDALVGTLVGTLVDALLGTLVRVRVLDRVVTGKLVASL